MIRVTEDMLVTNVRYDPSLMYVFVVVYEASIAGCRRDKEGGPHLLVIHVEPRLTHAEWEENVTEEKMSGDGSGNGGNKKKYREKFDKAKVYCYNCREYGNFADECLEPKKEMALNAIADTDDESMML
ncbi:hypothetical protein GUJ93_ZPchr0006g40661 [Zizania palustris]|uniref:CCHC-type domain-containing protein n=1 Tax=Zizania palustris TaxID=103762 RepID=A0A8J5SIA4_ZIZPA|nr:hypothetical protein GUJ93_ZPchr0006g40661 [Zizania palustris]